MKKKQIFTFIEQINETFNVKKIPNFFLKFLSVNVYKKQ